MLAPGELGTRNRVPQTHSLSRNGELSSSIPSKNNVDESLIGLVWARRSIRKPTLHNAHRQAVSDMNAITGKRDGNHSQRAKGHHFFDGFSISIDEA